MSNKTTMGELFELAITVEKAAEELYRGLEAKFVHHREVANFLGEYAAEEAGHAKQLESLRDTLSPEQLSAPADFQMPQDAHRILQSPVGKVLKGIKNLEEAYQLVHELEDSETNAILEFLITDFSMDRKAQYFLRVQLKEHIGRIMTEFPARFGDTASRLVVEALE
ncbi:MAG: hypothetical protein SXV54_24715 [Chloroflexota bacterium]|nr:hypothetical protein [Chloroflexota bacterium]